MWGQLDGGIIKVEVVRQVIGDFFVNRDNTVPLGVIAYAGSLSSGAQGMSVVMWPGGYELPSLPEIRGAVHGPAPADFVGMTAPRSSAQTLEPAATQTVPVRMRTGTGDVGRQRWPCGVPYGRWQFRPVDRLPLPVEAMAISEFTDLLLVGASDQASFPSRQAPRP